MNAIVIKRGGGFTIMEVVLSLFIAVTLLGGIIAAMFIAQNAMAGSAAKIDCISTEDRVTQMITLDISLATSIPERTDKAITLVVPTRNGDAQPETIRYAWSGTAGDPLTRQYNGGTAVTIAANVYQFNLTYLLKTLQP